MKSDLDRLMAARQLDALIVAGGEGENTPRHYLTNGASITGGYVIKKRGDAPVLIVNPMEIEEAAKSGLRVFTYHEFGWAELLQQAEGERTRAEVGLWTRMLEHFGIASGRVGVYGSGEINVYIELLRQLATVAPQYEFVGETGMTLFDEAYITKDADELARIRAVAEATSAVLQETWDFIAGHSAADEIVVKADGAPLTIGDVKRFVRRALLDHGLEDTAMIFAQGRDAGFPHSRGEDDQVLKLGQSIVFDLFPRELGGGYHHDSTRTWCLGYAPQHIVQAYQDVMNAFEVAVDTYKSGVPARALQEAVLDYLESAGHPTSRSHPGSMDGYVHSLGHGVGLNIHERPSLSHLSKDTLQPGNVISIEPGVYYPEQGYGIRVEDLFYVDADGSLVELTTFHKQLVLPIG